MSENKSIEEMFGELENTLSELESGEASLERSFELYEAGMKLVKACGEEIDTIEKKVLMLSGEGETVEFQ